MGITSILVEGGGRLLSALARERLIDRMAVCVAPKFLGGGGLDMFPDLNIDRMDGSMGLSGVEFRTFGDNVVVEGSYG
jgi:riboflavin biosynthesis pyrimidine reductase